MSSMVTFTPWFDWFDINDDYRPVDDNIDASCLSNLTETNGSGPATAFTYSKGFEAGGEKRPPPIARYNRNDRYAYNAAQRPQVDGEWRCAFTSPEDRPQWPVRGRGVESLEEVKPQIQRISRPDIKQTYGSYIKPMGRSTFIGSAESDIDSTFELGTPGLTMASTTASTTPEVRNRPNSIGMPNELDIDQRWNRNPNYCHSGGRPILEKKLPSVRDLLPDLPSWSFPPTIPQVPVFGAQPEAFGANGVPQSTVISEREDDTESIASSWATSEFSWDSDSSDEAVESTEGTPKAVEVGTSDVVKAPTYGEDAVPSLQIGSAKIRVEVLSVSRLVDERISKNRNRGDRDNFCDEEDLYESEDERMIDSGLRDAGDNQGNNPENQTRDRYGICPPDQATKPSGRRKRSQNHDSDEENEDHQNRRKRPRRLPASLEVGPAQNALRFACPYQAFEPLLDCLRRGPRNPKGGCEGISRLKQHLHRRHVLSSRCPRCWVSFDKKSRLAEHVQQLNCHEIPRPDGEPFMEASHEILIERTNGGMSEDTWWALFQTLIPGMQARTVESLKMEYWPYYIYSDVPWPLTATLSLPRIAINLEDPILGQPGELTFPSAPQTLSVPVLATSLPGTSGPIRPQSAVTGTNEVIPVPARHHSVVRTPAEDPATSFDSIRTPYPSTGVSTSQTSHASPFSQNSTPNTTPSSTGANSAPTPGSGVISTTQLRRSYQRLQARSQRAETTITTLRETNRLVQGDVSRADAILEEIFALEQDEDLVIPAAMYDRLASISQILIDIGERLK